MAVSIFPLVEGATDQNASNGNAKIGLNENKNVLEVNAAYYYRHYKHYRHYRYYRYYRYYGYYHYRHYKYRHYKYRHYRKVRAAYSYRTGYYSASKADTSNDPKLNTIMKSGAKYKYRRGISTAAGLVKYGGGDCWAFSDYLNGKFRAAGYKSRIIQYATAYSSRHRSVQLYQTGKWKTVPYRKYGYTYLIV